MDSYSRTAQIKVDELTALAAAEPALAVAFQGAPGANSHLALTQYDSAALPLPCFAFEDAIDAVKEGSAALALIPIENSLHGRVADIHFLLPESGLSIVGEHFLRVHHCLMSKESDIAAIKTVMSHPQALGQIRHWTRANGVKPVNYADTAGAAAFVADSEEQGLAAAAPALAAELYGLNLLAENIEDADHNTTRFVALAQEPLPLGSVPSAEAMTTFVFEVKNIPAALYKALGGFATNGVNMTKLESYVDGESFSAAQFYADIVGAPGDPAVDRALEELAFHSKWVRLLGTYPMARDRG